MWRQPKTDWSSSDFFNLEDYIRIKENLEYLHGYAYHLFPTIDVEKMREHTSRLDLPRAYDFNRFERNLEKINESTFGNEIGDTLEYEPSGITIDADEMNRIESACLMLYGQLHERGKNHNRLGFKLGYKIGNVPPLPQFQCISDMTWDEAQQLSWGKAKLYIWGKEDE